MAHYQVSRTYADFDALAGEAEQWDLDLCQLDAGEFHGRILQFGIDRVHISEARFGRILKQQGAPPAELRTIVVPGSEDVAFKWRGADIDGESLMIFPQGAELDAISDASFHVFTCSFTDELLDGIAHNLGINPNTGSRGQREVVRCTTADMAKLRNLLRGLCRNVSADAETLHHSKFAEAMSWELPALLLATTASSVGRSEARLSASRRQQLLKTAETYIEHCADESPTVAELCQTLNSSLRTLQYAFAETYGISPKAYIRAIRLNKARKELLAADPAQFKVADIANRFGFWHMGQFAADYRRHFGELPSETHSGRKQTGQKMPA